MNELRMVLDGLFPNADLDENSIKKGLLAFSEYDLKEQFPFNEYKDRVVINKYYNSEELKGDKTKAFFVYKALTILDKDLEFCDKKASTFDPDNSSGKCDFTKELYNVLWGFNYEYGYFGTIDVFPIIDNKSLLWGGDCLNSLQTTIYSKFGISTYKCLEQMSENEKSFLDKMKKSAMGTLFEVSHAPGNFGIVPAYFNGYRGTSSCLHDYLPQSLFFLKESKNHDYSLVDKLEAYTRNSKYKNGDAKLYFQEYSPKIFRKYINIMMLWDLVSYKNDGTIDVYDYNGSKIKGLAEAQVMSDGELQSGATAN